MSIKVLTIPFSLGKEVFEDEDVNRFLMNKRVKELKAEFFALDGRPFWTVFIHYDLSFV
jgi:hypothetical protein